MSTFLVSNSDDLRMMLGFAQGGDRIELAPGLYSGLSFRDLSFAENVTITSADPTDKAVLGNFTITGSSGLTFSNLEVVASAPAYAAIDVSRSSAISFDRIHLHGSLDGNSANDINGIRVLSSSNISLTNSELQQLGRGAVFAQTTNITVTGNFAHSVRTDGFDFAEVGFVKISGNVIKSFGATGDDHPDGIQFWTSGTKTASHDIEITGNAILRGDGTWSEGIFMRDELGTLPYLRVTISDNLIVGTGYNAIRVIGANGLTVSGNELISFAGDTMKTFMLIEDSANVTSTNNKAIAIAYTNVTGLTQSGNVLTDAIADKGAAAISAWAGAHLDLYQLLTGSPPPAPVAPPVDPFSDPYDMGTLTGLTSMGGLSLGIILPDPLNGLGEGAFGSWIFA